MVAVVEDHVEGFSANPGPTAHVMLHWPTASMIKLPMASWAAGSTDATGSARSPAWVQHGLQPPHGTDPDPRELLARFTPQGCMAPARIRTLHHGVVEEDAVDGEHTTSCLLQSAHAR